MIEIIPSLASAHQLNLQSEIDSLGKVGRIHLDIEDGNFIDNITFGMKTVKAVSEYTQKKLDAHLMVTNPAQYIDTLMDLGVMNIAIHAEAMQYPMEHLNKIRIRGGQAGMAFNFQAPVEIAKIYEPFIDYILIMTSEPDLENQQFRRYALEKIRHAREILSDRVSIYVDGGISEELLPEVIAAGADTIIMGRAIWGSSYRELRHAELTKLANSYI